MRQVKWIICAAAATAIGCLAYPAVGLAATPLSGKGVITASEVRLREQPSTRTQILHSMDKGDVVRLISEEDGWYYVDLGNVKGYVSGQYLQQQDGGSSGSGAESYVALRMGSKGSEVRKLQQDLITLGYLKVKATGEFSSRTRDAVRQFQKDQDLTVDGVAGSATQKKLAAAASGESNSTAATVEYRTLREGDSGEEVKKLQQELREKGYFSGAADGVYGADTTSAVLAFQRDAKIGADGKAGPVTQGKLFGTRAADYATLRHGDSGSDVTKLQERLRSLGYLNEKADGEYQDATRNAVTAFQKNNKLTQDGIAGVKTQQALFGSSARAATDRQEQTPEASAAPKPTEQAPQGSADLTATPAPASTQLPTVNGKVELSEWFGDVENLWKRNTYATVIDVRTGVSWTMKRFGGWWHADVEPKTKEDTAKMKETWGGKWSGSRRPVWVVIDGRYLAASLMGSPHGVETIEDNDMTGQVCIHFKGSKIHESGRVDDRHQAAVQEAFQAGQSAGSAQAVSAP